MNKESAMDWAWLAGLLESKGAVEKARTRNPVRLKLEFDEVEDRDAAEKAARLMRTEVQVQQPSFEKNRMYSFRELTSLPRVYPFTCCVEGQDAEWVLQQIAPYLTPRAGSAK